MSLSTTEIAWCGGVIDAIGLVRVREVDTGSHLPSVAVSTPQVPIAQRLADLTGVKVTTVSRNYKRMGCGEHCTEAHLHVVSVTARWSLTGARARAFLLAVRPYLYFKAEEVDQVLSATEDAPRKPRTTAKMAELGWPIGGAA